MKSSNNSFSSSFRIHCSLSSVALDRRLTPHAAPSAFHTDACCRFPVVWVNSGVACSFTVGIAAMSPRWGEGWSVDFPVTVAAAALVMSLLAGEGMPCIARIRHTAPFLMLSVPNSVTVHPRSFSLKAVLAASFFFLSGYSLQRLFSGRYILCSLLRIVRLE
jgi:hypothetical protein